jgi:hypothetical protein
VARLVIPAAVPLALPGRSEPLQCVAISHPDCPTFDDDIHPDVPLIATGQKNDTLIAVQVGCFLLGLPGAEMQRFIEPDGDEWRHVGSAVGPHGRYPEQLGSFQRLASVFPARSGGPRIAAELVQRGGWHRHDLLLNHPSWLKS